MNRNKALSLIPIILLWILGCQRSPDDIVVPFKTKSPTPVLAKNALPEGFVLNESGFTAEVIADALTAPEGADMRENGVMYVAQSTKANIMKIMPSGNTTQFAQIPFVEPTAPALIDLLIDPLRGMFVSLLRHGKIFNVTFNGHVTEFASGLNYPLFLALDSEKNIYVSELFGFRITKFDPAGNSTVMIQLDSESRPRGLAFDSQEQLYVLSGGTGEIRCFDIKAFSSFPLSLSDGIVVATIPGISPELQAQDLTFGFDGDLFTIGINEVYRVKLNGVVSTFAAGLQGPFNAINMNKKGDLIISDYAQNVEGAGKIIKVRRAH